MSIDTQDKRSSALSQPFSILYPVADGGISVDDKRQALGLYRGPLSGTSGSIWNAFWTQLTTDTTLLEYVGDITHFYEGFQEAVLNPNAYPIVTADLIAIPEDSWIGIPKRKISLVTISVHHKVFSGSYSERIDDSLTLDRYVRNAIEKDLKLGGVATLVKVSDTVFNNLSENIREGILTINIITNRFTAGGR